MTRDQLIQHLEYFYQPGEQVLAVLFHEEDVKDWIKDYKYADVAEVIGEVEEYDWSDEIKYSCVDVACRLNEEAFNDA